MTSEILRPLFQFFLCHHRRTSHHDEQRTEDAVNNKTNNSATAAVLDSDCYFATLNRQPEPRQDDKSNNISAIIYKVVEPICIEFLDEKSAQQCSAFEFATHSKPDEILSWEPDICKQQPRRRVGSGRGRSASEDFGSQTTANPIRFEGCRVATKFSHLQR